MPEPSSFLRAISPFPHLPLHLHHPRQLFLLLVSNLTFFFFLSLFFSSDIKMMPSLLINSIRSALYAPERWDGTHHFQGIITKRQLKNLKLFVLCARKLGNDAQLRFVYGKVSTLGSLLQRIHDALPYDWDAIDNLKKEIDGWYNTLLVSLIQPTFDEVMEIIDSVLENLNVLFDAIAGRSQLIEVMIEKITFLRNFIRFATLRSVEPQQLLDNLLAHIQAVAVNAAHISFICIFQDLDVELNIPVLLQIIKMVDPQVDEICTKVLISSKLSTKLHSPIPDKDQDPSVIMKDFIDSLLWNLWERLHMEAPIVIYTNSELQLVYEGLRLLRSMLMEQPNKFDKKIGELTRLAIYDAGVIIFSLCQKDMEIFVSASELLQIVKGKDFSILDLLQRISHISQRVERISHVSQKVERISHVSQRVEGKGLSILDSLRRIHSAREQVGGNDLLWTIELGFINFVLENLLRMTSSKECSGLQSQFRMLHSALSPLRYSLGKIKGLHNEQKDLEDIGNDVVKVANNLEFLIDQLVFGYFQGSSSASFDSVVEDILNELKSINSNLDRVVFQNIAPVVDECVGFDDDIRSIISQLTGGPKQLKMFAIVGMPGIGKTTLATKVFNHPSVTFHFHVRLQCCISLSFDKKKLLLELCKQVDPNTNIEMNEHDLANKLRRHLKGKRYLIFLDDVWDIDAWDSLRTSFPDDSYESNKSNKSRILVTSRHRDAVPQASLYCEPFSPHLLTEDQSWELLRKKLSSTIEQDPPLCELGKQIAANCKGLPLALVVVAGLLANMEPQGWEKFLESINSFSGANHCMYILESSYQHLPGHLKQCFLYFGLFPEDHEVSAKKLIQLWIAEGFVRKTESNRLEDEARANMMDLVNRSLVIVSKERSRGGVKAFRIHDLLHDFCRTKAKDEKFFQPLYGGDNEFLTLPELGYMRRLCVHSDKKPFKNLRLFCPRLHSLLFFPHDEQHWREHDDSFIIPRYSGLRVLDIDQYPLNFWDGILSEIGLVFQLKYLSVRGNISDIPSFIDSLTNLETLILNSDKGEVSMPDTFWKLQKLKHVAIRSGFRLEFENLENFPELCKLLSCSGAIIGRGESFERLVRKFPNIRKLRCYVYWEDSDEIESLKLDSLSQLESLHLSTRLLTTLLEFDFPDNLRKLSLRNLSLHQSSVSRIGKLGNLEVLKLKGVNFHEDTWNMEGEFKELRFLGLDDSRIVRWTTASDYQFPCLQKLVLASCRFLEDIVFESIDTLDMVEVTRCCDSVISFFKRIQDEQTELENSLPKIQIT